MVAPGTHTALPAEKRPSSEIGDNLMRPSAGVEDIEDLRDDLEQAFAYSGGQEMFGLSNPRTDGCLPSDERNPRHHRNTSLMTEEGTWRDIWLQHQKAVAALLTARNHEDAAKGMGVALLPSCASRRAA